MPFTLISLLRHFAILFTILFDFAVIFADDIFFLRQLRLRLRCHCFAIFIC